MVAALLLLTPSATDPVAEGAVPRVLGEGYAFTEGPTADRDGNVFFTDQPNNRILRWEAGSGAISEWRKPAGRSNGMAFDRRGGLIACADEKNQLWRFPPNGPPEVLVGTYDGKPLNGPNDVFVHRSGRLYITDPFYKRPWWGPDATPGQSVQAVYLWEENRPLRRVDADLKQPNGVAGTPDGKILYVSDIGAGITYRYDIATDGTLRNRREFYRQGSDGMTVDTEGNLYLTGRGVTVIGPDGQLRRQIDIPEGWTANVTFGGKDRRTLFVTASTRVYGLAMRVRGTE